MIVCAYALLRFALAAPGEHTASAGRRIEPTLAGRPEACRACRRSREHAHRSSAIAMPQREVARWLGRVLPQPFLSVRDGARARSVAAPPERSRAWQCASSRRAVKSPARVLSGVCVWVLGLGVGPGPGSTPVSATSAVVGALDHHGLWVRIGQEPAHARQSGRAPAMREGHCLLRHPQPAHAPGRRGIDLAQALGTSG